MSNQGRIRKPGYHVISIKLRSNNRSGPTAYTDILKLINEKRIIVPTRGDEAMIFRTQFQTEIENVDVLYGSLAKFTRISKDKWIDMDRLEAVDGPEIPSNLFPNLRDFNYVFVPSIHRFAFARSISPSMVKKFLTTAVKEVIGTDEQHEVDIQLSRDGIEMIRTAQKIMRISFELSYSNNDLTSDFTALLDSEYRNMNAGKVFTNFDQGGPDGLNLENKTLKGLLDLSQNNGTAVARILDSDNHVRKVKTEDYPETVTAEGKTDEVIRSSLVHRLIAKFGV